MNLLDKIVAHKRSEIAERKSRVPVSELLDAPTAAGPRRSLIRSLNGARPFSIIAEFKRRSPSAGTFASILDPVHIASGYESAGAAGISVLTDGRFFGGTGNDLTNVRNTVALPVLRKDFIIDEYQMYEAKGMGADAVLLIAAILDRIHLRDLFEAARGLGMECLVELYDRREIDTLDFDRMPLIGVNNRNLSTLEVDINNTIEIRNSLPAGITVVSESGLSDPAHFRTLKREGIGAALVGEFFLKSPSPDRALKQLLDDLDDASR